MSLITTQLGALRHHLWLSCPSVKFDFHAYLLQVWTVHCTVGSETADRLLYGVIALTQITHCPQPIFPHQWVLIIPLHCTMQG